MELRKELYDAVNEAAKPIQGDIRQALPGFLPNRYARVLDADLSVSVRKRTGGLEPGVSIVATARGAKKRRPRNGRRRRCATRSSMRSTVPKKKLSEGS